MNTFSCTFRYPGRHGRIFTYLNTHEHDDNLPDRNMCIFAFGSSLQFTEPRKWTFSFTCTTTQFNWEEQFSLPKMTLIMENITRLDLFWLAGGIRPWRRALAKISFRDMGVVFIRISLKFQLRLGKWSDLGVLSVFGCSPVLWDTSIVCLYYDSKTRKHPCPGQVVLSNCAFSANMTSGFLVPLGK